MKATLMTHQDESNPLACFCFNVTQQEIMAVIQTEPIETMMDILDYCKAGNGCSSCWPLLQELLSLKPPQAGNAD